MFCDGRYSQEAGRGSSDGSSFLAAALLPREGGGLGVGPVSCSPARTVETASAKAVIGHGQLITTNRPGGLRARANGSEPGNSVRRRPIGKATLMNANLPSFAAKAQHAGGAIVPENWIAWATAERLARRIYELTTVPMRSENHPTWDPTWRAAINNGLRAISTGDEATMEHALHEINRLAETL